MVRVLQWGQYRVYVYKERGGRHHRPHCHVYWTDGDATVALDDLKVIDGDPIAGAVREVLLQHRRCFEQPGKR